MKRLTENEIKFIKETKVTPTVMVCEEWRRTPYANLAEATERAADLYQVSLSEILDKCAEDDGISLEYMASYLLYTFFSLEELENMTTAAVLDWLQDFKYFCGFRKWNENWAEIAMSEALDVYYGYREFYDTEDGEVWNREIEA